ncbi:MAG: methylenetetrahydrofolate reductase [NAD(P)H] [Pseudomonadota bacterium]
MKPRISCEFFPPRTKKGQKTFDEGVQRLLSLRPDFFSVTFGAGGSTQAKTHDIVLSLNQQSNVEVAPHLSCITSTRDTLCELIHDYKDQGINRIVALRGDIPADMSYDSLPGEFFYARDLIELIRQETGDHFHIEVGAYPEFHPQAESSVRDLEHFKAKVEMGANSAITQYFYNADAYFRFLESCQQMGVDIPIMPGVMPINNYVQLARFSAACGAEIPRWLDQRIKGFGADNTAIWNYGADVVTDLCERLLAGGAPGLHFYTLNQAELTMEIAKRLGLLTAEQA